MGGPSRRCRADADAVDEVLTASRSLGAVATRSLGAAAEETMIARYRARADRRAVLVSVTAAGRMVVGEAAARRRALIETILATLPEDAQRAVAEALRGFADAAGEIPDGQWLSPAPAGEAPRPRVPGCRGRTDEGDRA
jgi:hypothetical protein